MNILIVLLGILLSSQPRQSIVDPADFVAMSTTAETGIHTDTTRWALIFEDDFYGNENFDTSKWSFCDRGKPAWKRYLTKDPSYAYLFDGQLILRMDNKDVPYDDLPYHSAGIETRSKFSFTYGKVEVRAKFKQGQGSWPAIWMMPEKSTYGEWPNSGEIDIMEHVNYEGKVHQSIHNSSVTGSDGGSSASHATPYNVNEYNLYGLIWTPDSISFFVNDTLRFSYTRPSNATPAEWPYDRPFYLILNQSGGMGWSGPVKDEDLPFYMKVDWVKVYQKE